METQDLLPQEKENLSGEVMESLGEPQESGSATDEIRSEEGHDPVYVQKRLKQQKRAHEREISNLRDEVMELRRHVQQSQTQVPATTGELYEDPGVGNIQHHIQQAVHLALNAKQEEEKKARDREAQAYVDRQNQDLHQHLDKMSDKYEDFDDTVRHAHTPFTNHMHAASLMLPRTGPGSAGEVLYKLAKNRSELERIGKLHPLDQASEMVKLSHALMGDVDKRSTSSSQSSNPMSSVKHTPVKTSREINENTPISELRKMAKSGWK